MTERLRLGVPNEGRLVEPTVARLRNAGSQFVGPWAHRSAVEVRFADQGTR